MDTEVFQGNVLDPNCPSRLVLARIGDKWSTLVIHALADSSLRFSELRSRVGVVTAKVLTQSLRALERDGLVKRTIYAQVPPRVDYELTDLGCSLLEPLTILRDWAEKNAPTMISAQENFDEEEDAKILG